MNAVGRWIPLGLAIAVSVAGCTDEPPSPEFVTMRDGVRLATDVYLPEGDGPFPTVLIRTPYNREFDAYAGYRFNRHGIAVVTQDTRGRYESEGDDLPFVTDADDGYDTCAWIVSQEWSDGKIAMIGSSATGITAYLAAAAGAPGLVGISSGQATPNVASDAVFQDGVRRHALSHNWLVEQGNVEFAERFREHPTADDPYWDSIETDDELENVVVAGVHYAGWFDIFQQGGIDAFVGYQTRAGDAARGAQRLIIGPWTHRADGEISYPENSDEPPFLPFEDALLDAVLDPAVPLAEQVFEDMPNVQYYLMGAVDEAGAPGNEWRTAEHWPVPAAQVRMHLGEGGLLAEACPDAASAATAYVFDPDDPSPTRCGTNMTIDAGSCDQRDIERRDDVIVFETAPLEQPLEVVGRITAKLFVSIDQPDADLMVRLTDVYPDGRSMLVADGALRLAGRNGSALQTLSDGQVVRADVDLWSTAMVFNAGHRVRISITSSNWPRFAVNRNNGLPYPDSIEGEKRVVAVTVHHDAAHASYLELPVPARPLDSVVACDATE